MHKIQNIIIVEVQLIWIYYFLLESYPLYLLNEYSWAITYHCKDYQGGLLITADFNHSQKSQISYLWIFSWLWTFCFHGVHRHSYNDQEVKILYLYSSNLDQLRFLIFIPHTSRKEPWVCSGWNLTFYY